MQESVQSCKESLLNSSFGAGQPVQAAEKGVVMHLLKGAPLVLCPPRCSLKGEGLSKGVILAAETSKNGGHLLRTQ